MRYIIKLNMQGNQVRGKYAFLDRANKNLHIVEVFLNR